MAVVTRRRANKFDLVEFVPWRRTENSELKRKLHHVVHNVERRAVAHDDFLRLYAEKLSEKFSRLFETCGFSVIARVYTAHHKVAFAGIFEHRHCDLQLLFAGTAARHIHTHAFFDEFLVRFLLLRKHLFELASFNILIVHTNSTIHHIARVDFCVQCNVIYLA